MRFQLSIAALFMACTASSGAFSAEPVGVRNISIFSPQRNSDLEVTVWYPSVGDGEKTLVGDNRIFEGSPAFKDATIRAGQFPLVLLSHGSGSRVEGMAWIAVKLAEAGFIVAGANHPGTTSGHSTPQDTPKIWERTQDLSSLVTSLTTDKAWMSSVSQSSVGVLGFSLGGAAAMEISGLRADLDSFVKYCEDHSDMMDCRWFAGERGYVNNEAVSVPKLDLRTVDKARFEQSNRDPRIKAAVLVDPGLATVIQPESSKDVAIPLTFINLGDDGKVPVGVKADELSHQISSADYVRLGGADHFSFLPVCKKDANAFLQSIGELDPICSDAGLRDRAEIHQELIKTIVDAFTGALKNGH